MLARKLTEEGPLEIQSLNFMCLEYISKEFMFLIPLFFKSNYFMQLQQKNGIQFLKAINLKVRYLTCQFFKKFLPKVLHTNPVDSSH